MNWNFLWKNFAVCKAKSHLLCFSVGQKFSSSKRSRRRSAATTVVPRALLRHAWSASLQNDNETNKYKNLEIICVLAARHEIMNQRSKTNAAQCANEINRILEKISRFFITASVFPSNSFNTDFYKSVGVSCNANSIAVRRICNLILLFIKANECGIEEAWQHDVSCATLFCHILMICCHRKFVWTVSCEKHISLRAVWGYTRAHCRIWWK